MTFDERPDLVGIAAAIAAVLLALFVIAEDDDQPVSPAYALNLETVEPAPIQYVGPAAAKILFLYPQGVESLCTNAGAGPSTPDRVVAACAQNDVMVMPDPCLYPDDNYAALMCHEKAHIMGWRH